mmetsp:Transcript_60186/g.82515  ORF Transcript_60186/g.82515 Transcript_60186/m.82515 type:complete len:100 (-) Transcript_60186:564-863(-)
MNHFRWNLVGCGEKAEDFEAVRVEEERSATKLRMSFSVGVYVGRCKIAGPRTMYKKHRALLQEKENAHSESAYLRVLGALAFAVATENGPTHEAHRWML